MSASPLLLDPPQETAADAPVSDRPAVRSRGEAPQRDVWSRTEPKYRVRAAVLLIVNLGLFCGLCVFTFWLREARLFDYSPSSYVLPFAFWSTQAPSLDDFLTETINVERTPLHALVLGLLFGALATVPISIAILYRFPCSIPFVAALVVFAHMPWLALMLLIGCVLASVRPFRLSFRYGAALVGLIPVVLYLLFAGGKTGDVPSASSPAQLTLLAAPWVLAILAAAAMLAVILQFARWVDYRPGTVAPAVAVMFAAPLLLFHAGVGVDELDYRALERRYGPASEVFAPRRDARPMLFGLLRTIVNDESLLQRYETDFLALSRGEPLANPRRLLAYFNQEFLRERAEAYEACKRFLQDYPASRYVPAVLYLQGRALDTRLDEQMLYQRRPQRELYFDEPHVQSRGIWEALLERADSPVLVAIAALRLARIEARLGEIEAARRTLQIGLSRSDPRTASRPVERGLLSAGRPEESLHLDAGPAREEARELLERISVGRSDERYGAAPLVEWVRLSARRPGYRQHLLRIVERYPDCRIEGLLLTEYAAGLPDDTERRTALARLSERLPAGPARTQALLRLGEIDLRVSEDEAGRARRRGALERLRAVVASDERSVWVERAARLLRMYGPAPLE